MVHCAHKCTRVEEEFGLNYLLHAWLAGPDVELQLGAFLGDHVRGRQWQEYAPGVGLGILLHRKIDAATDQHAAFLRAKQRLPKSYHRYAGIILDIYFDHLFAKRWVDFEPNISLDAFSASVQGLLTMHSASLPASMNRFREYMLIHNLPKRYQSRTTIESVLRGVSKRLRRSNPIGDALPILEETESKLEEDLLELLDDLIPATEAWRQEPQTLLPET